MLCLCVCPMHVGEEMGEEGAGGEWSSFLVLTSQPPIFISKQKALFLLFASYVLTIKANLSSTLWGQVGQMSQQRLS